MSAGHSVAQLGPGFARFLLLLLLIAFPRSSKSVIFQAECVPSSFRGFGKPQAQVREHKETAPHSLLFSPLSVRLSHTTY